VTENTRNSPLSARVETGDPSLEDIAIAFGLLADKKYFKHVERFVNNIKVKDKTL
jgi:hypothetical protein